MSLAELQQKVSELSREDRLRLVAYIRHLEQSSDAAWLDEITERNSRMTSGQKFSIDDLDRAANETSVG